jgi:hypothetical protein
MYNFNNLGGLVKLRKGHSYFFGHAPGGTIETLNVESYDGTSPKLFVLIDLPAGLTWYNAVTAAVVHSIGLGGDDEIQTLYFNGYLFFFGEVALRPASIGPQYWNGTAWGTAGYTWPASFNPFGGCVHKNRAYFIERQSSAYAYSEIDAISGATTKVDLAGVLQSKANLYIIRSLSVTQGQSPQNLAAFLFANGEVLVYEGSYPDGSDWRIALRFQISPPLFNNSVVDAKGDSFIFTETEVLSLRGVFANGYDKESAEGIGASIKNRWTQIIAGVNATSDVLYVKGIYDKKNDRIIISFPCYVDPITGVSDSTKIFQLIYDFTLGAWYEYFMTAASVQYVPSAAYFEGSSYVLAYLNGSARLMKLESKTTFLDDDISGTGTNPINYTLRTVPLPIQKFGANSIDGVEVIAKSDLYPQTNYKFIADLGRQTTDAQPLAAQGTSIAKPMVNVGISGSIVTQLEVSGSSVSSSVGLELYAFNVWFNPGEKGSR